MRRPEKVAELVREEIAQIVGYELEDPRLAGVTVTEVRMSENMREARVYYTVAGTEAEAAAAQRALEHATAFVRRELALELNLRRTPFVHFIRDTVEEQAARVDELLTDIERARAPEAAPPAAESVERRDEG
ncbi:MAG TPA: 30S ribosome-binding factor RbfA [Pyrinomonadaceae bacterium]|jgi:ribosome-binding factor A